VDSLIPFINLGDNVTLRRVTNNARKVPLR